MAENEEKLAPLLPTLKTKGWISLGESCGKKMQIIFYILKNPQKQTNKKTKSLIYTYQETVFKVNLGRKKPGKNGTERAEPRHIEGSDS